MNKAKAKEITSEVEKSASRPVSVPAKSWDPADPSQNHNADQPVYVSPKAIPNNPPFAGMQGGIREGGGESRPMFSTSLKE